MIAIFAAVLVALADPPPSPAPQEHRWSSADSFLDLMNEPRAAAILYKYAPDYIRLIEQQVVPPPSSELTLDDFARIPATGVTAETLKIINEKLAQIPADRR